MRNKIEKTNKTKFDYVARTLGVFGFVIIAIVTLIGGITLSSINNDNTVLLALINKSEDEIPYKTNKNNTQTTSEDYVVEDDYE